MSNWQENWEVLKAIVFERDGNECVRCSTSVHLTVHHIKPRAEGGSDDPINLITLCNSCHDAVELDPTELFVQVRARKAQRAYYNRHRGNFSKLELSEIKTPYIKIRHKCLHHKTSILARYLQAHPLTQKELDLRETSNTFRKWVEDEAMKYYKTLKNH